jgi:tRNA1(Val) A37 N6-methylase TrmN6
MEMRGNIFDYAETAFKLISTNGWFVCCHAGNDPRLEEAMNQVGFSIRHRQDVIFREGKQPTISILACTKSKGTRNDWTPITIRDSGGKETIRYLEIRNEMGHNK